MQIAKTREQLLREPMLKQSEIKTLFGISYYEAKKAFKKAAEIDNDELGVYRVSDTKVRYTSVLKVSGFTRKQLEDCVLGIKKAIS